MRGKGEADADAESQPVLIERTSSVLVSGGVWLSITEDAHYERIILCIRSASLARGLAHRSGDQGPIRVAPSRSLADTPGRLLLEQVMFLAAQLSVPLRPPAVVLAEFEQGLMAMFLRANAHNYSHLFETDAPAPSRARVRRTDEYIAAHRDEPLTFEDIAETSGASVLSVSRSFRSQRGYSLREFVRRTRSGKADAE